MQKVSVSTLHFYKTIPSRKETQNLISVPVITHNIQAQKISLLHFYSCRNHTFKAQKHICIFPLQLCFPGFINCQFSNAQQKRQKREDWFTFIIPPDSINKDWKGKHKIKFIEKLLQRKRKRGTNLLHSMKTWATFSIKSQKGQEIGTEELNVWSNVCVTRA